MSATHQKVAQGEESRARLLEAAADLVGAGGYTATSVDAIARRAGVVKSALYWHFGSKNGLLLAALEHRTDQWIADVEAAVERAAVPMERLDRLIDHIRDVITERPETQRMVFSFLLERGHSDEACRQTINRVFRRLVDALNKGFSEAVQLPTAQLEDVAEGIVCHSHGLLLHYLADGDRQRLDRSLDAVRKNALRHVESILRRLSSAPSQPS